MDDWEGIEISSVSGSVREIRLRGSEDRPGELTGSIPPELGTLVELWILDLAFNQLTGPIPPQLGQLTDLNYLFLAYNRLTGSIPPELEQLNDLRQLWLSGNELTGAIPPGLGSLTGMTYLGIDNNELHGPIPPELGQLVDLTRLYLHANRLSGSIPSELGRLSQLEVLNLRDNELTGPIPPELGQLSQLTELWLYRNELTGRIPAELGRLSQLQKLSLFDNELTGSIPPELGRLSQLTGLWLYRNALTGHIPPELGRLSRLQNLSLGDNQLTGPIPPELGQLSQLTELWLYRNELTGRIPAELGRLSQLQKLSLFDNELTGSIPPELGQLSQLTELWLYRNALTGRIPPELGQLDQLTGLWLHQNELTGTIPAELGQLPNLKTLNLGGNSLTGSIPGELGRSTNLSLLYLWGNKLTGTVPPELADLPNLRDLELQNNRLTGELPWRLWERAEQGKLDLSLNGNAIAGVGAPPPRSQTPSFSGSASVNGNASHHSVAYFQGPLVWEWDWTGQPQEHHRPILGRWGTLLVRIDHETREPPLVITRVLNSANTVLADRLSEARPPDTESTGSARWRTEYAFELPGSLYRSGNQIVHVIDPDNDLAETDETDNVGELIRLYGEQPPRFRVTFIPLHVSGDEPPSVDPSALMSGARAFLPIADNFQAVIGSPLQSDAADKFELLNEVRALWNANADPDEFYHGIFHSPWTGSGHYADRIGGVASQPGQVGVSEISLHDIIPHELGHNLSLQHTPGCNADSVDADYPHTDGALGPGAGWDVNWRRLIDGNNSDATDVMSYCGDEHFISDYHYRKATDYWLDFSAAQGAGLLSQVSRRSPRGLGPSGVNSPGNPPPITLSQAAGATDVGALALSGRINASGTWRLTHAQRTDRSPRPPAMDGSFTLILLDGAGAELYREPLSPIPVSEGGEAGWAARTPIPTRPARAIQIVDPQGVTVLRAQLPPAE